MTHGILRHPVKYVVFAGNFREFRVWQLASGVKNGDALFVGSLEKANLRALQNLDVKFVKLATFHLRSDAKDIMEYARSVWPNAPEFQTTIS